MPKRGDAAFLGDIQQAIERIERYTDGISYEAFRGDSKTQDAVIRNLEIIGDAVKNLSKEFRRKHKNVRWTDIAGMRDRLIHHYFGVNWEIVWDVIRIKLPELRAMLHSSPAAGRRQRP